MSDVAEIEARIKFDTERLALAVERAAAYETRDIDPDRWKAAKQAHAEFRTAVKMVAVEAGTRADGHAAAVTYEEN